MEMESIIMLFEKRQVKPKNKLLLTKLTLYRNQYMYK